MSMIDTLLIAHQKKILLSHRSSSFANSANFIFDQSSDVRLRLDKFNQIHYSPKTKKNTNHSAKKYENNSNISPQLICYSDSSARLLKICFFFEI